MVATLKTTLQAGDVGSTPAPVIATPFNAESVSAHGTVTAPAAAAVLATIAAGSLPAGLYRIETQSVYGGGAPAAPEDLNIEIRKAAVAVKRVVSPRALHVPVHTTVTTRLTGSQAINVVAVATATAAVVYNVSVTATKIGD